MIAQIQSVANAFPENWTLVIATLIIVFVGLVVLAAVFMSGKGGE